MTGKRPLLLPFDIWIQIAHDIPPLDLEDLLSVNSAFFHLAMEQRYRQISFAYLGRKMMRLLWRLKDPYVAKRVRILHMHPHFIKELMEADSFPNASDSLFSLFAKHKKLLTFRPTKSHPRKRVYTLDQVVLTLINVLSGLPNLCEYHIAWVSPSLPSLPAFLTTPFLYSPITRLSLEMTLENLETLHPVPCLGNLRELDLFLRPGHMLDGTGYDMILAHTLAPFVATIANLDSLSLRLFKPLDISPLFSSLPVLPKLHTLSITIPLTAPHLGDPDAFADFLNAHTHTLRHLSLRASNLSFGVIDARLANWMQTAFYAVRVESLKVLEMGVGLIPTESVRLVVGRFLHAERLVLTGRLLTLAEVVEVLDTVGPGLKRLRIGPVVLSPQMVDVFAVCIPELDRLELVVTHVVPWDEDGVIPRYEAESEYAQDESQVTRFFEEMRRRQYDDWALGTLEFVNGRGRCSFEKEWRELWHGCVPRLRQIII
ncbi:hypothetical protein BDZ89DRAFT_1062446 [Hymenopellis radicata]|nr:hypothetical protein BDZ89DRAFT_1062446 [Hymenopellis radicata]